MTPKQIHLVRHSFALTAGRREPIAAAFFAHLFDLDPALRLLFAGDLRRRGAKLVHAVQLIVEELHRLHIFAPALEALAVRYSGYGLDGGHYALIGEALRRTARDSLGDAFTAEAEAALDAAFDALSSVMLAAVEFEPRLAA